MSAAYPTMVGPDRSREDESRADAAARAHETLRAEFMAACVALNPEAPLQTPTYSRVKWQSLKEVFFGELEEAEQASLMRLLLDIARGEPVTDVMRLRTNLIVGEVASRHAERHCEALVEQGEA